jgi:2-polyprenyl-6-methoxyphenol hydroxylase-like FAD-dependent oxidoreductase
MSVPDNKLETNSHAIVIGGSIAGLLAARILAEDFERVTIIERDYYPENSDPRSGVPQSNQGHFLLAQGKQILEELFSGFAEELSEKGAVQVDVIKDWLLLSEYGWLSRFSSDLTTLSCTRNLIENIIRKRLLSYTHLTFMEGHQVFELLTSSDKKEVTGVQLKDSQGRVYTLRANLTVDASGRNSKAIQWLLALGYEKPQEQSINSFLGYATRWYQCPSPHHADWKGIALMPKAPEFKRGGLIIPVEGNRWAVTLSGIGGDYPPTDEIGFLQFARSLRSPDIYQAIKDAHPLSPAYGYRRTENHHRHFEKLKNFPENFLILGDAACSFNPVYGQGMTVAALGALTLKRCLQQQKSKGVIFTLKGISRRFQNQLAQINYTPWLMATSEDLSWPTTVGGETSPIMRLLHSYMKSVKIVSCHSRTIQRIFAEVIHMTKPSSVFFRPDVFIPALFSLLSLSNQTEKLSGRYPLTLED